MNIISFDLGKKCTAWAYPVEWWEDGHTITHIELGSWSFKDCNTHGEIFHKLYIKLEGLLNDELWYVRDPLIIFEHAHYRGAAPTIIGVGMQAILLKFAHENGIKIDSVNSNVLKKYVKGKYGFSGKMDKDKMVEAYTKETGKEPETHDIADAFFLLKYAMERLDSNTKSGRDE